MLDSAAGQVRCRGAQQTRPAPAPGRACPLARRAALARLGSRRRSRRAARGSRSRLDAMLDAVRRARPRPDPRRPAARGARPSAPTTSSVFVFPWNPHANVAVSSPKRSVPAKHLVDSAAAEPRLAAARRPAHARRRGARRRRSSTRDRAAHRRRARERSARRARAATGSKNDEWIACSSPSSGRSESSELRLRRVPPHVALDQHEAALLGLVPRLDRPAPGCRVNGFSTSTCLPAASARIVHSKWSAFGSAM